jgi:hypothetical protein
MVASSEIICYLPCSFQIRGTLNSKKSRSMCMNEESTIVRTSDQFNFFWHYFASILQRGQIIMSTSMPLLCGYWIVNHHMPREWQQGSLQRGQIIMSTSMPLLCGYWIVNHHMPREWQQGSVERSSQLQFKTTDKSYH